MLKFKSLPQLLNYFSSEDKAIEYFAQMRWNGKPTCPHCGSPKPYKTARKYRCSAYNCRKDFSVRVGSIFENSKIPLKTWFAAIYLLTSHKRGISSAQLAIDLGITQKSAWFMLHRIREMMSNQAVTMLGEDKIIESDEAFIGGKDENRHYSKKRSIFEGIANDGTLYNTKKVVIGMIERGGNIVLKHIENTRKDSILPVINKYIPLGKTIYTDEGVGYSTLSTSYKHFSINHSAKQYVSGDVHTNTIENFWSLLKRGIVGVYYQVSKKHIDRYLNEFATRFNGRTIDPYIRFEIMLRNSKGRLTYKTLTAKN